MFETYGVSTLVVALVAVGAAVLAGWRRPFLVLALLLFGLLFHEAFRRLLGGPLGIAPSVVDALSRWWVLVILGLLFVVGLKTVRTWIAARRIPRPTVPDLLLGAVVVWGLWSTFTSPNLTAGVAAFRNYFQPVGVFVLARSIRPSRRDLRRLAVVWLGLGVLMVGIEVWQLTGWTPEDYRDRGYVRPNGELVVPMGSRYLRPASTVTGPNELALHLVLLTAFGLQLAMAHQGGQRWLPVGLAVVYVGGLAITESRSGFLALIMALAVCGAIGIASRRGGRRGDPGRPARSQNLLWGAVAVAFVAVLLGLGMLSRIAGTVRNLSEEYHFQDTFGAVEHLLVNPGGVGMGLVGPREGMFFPDDEVFHVEGSLFQIAMEMGVLGLGLWLAFLTSAGMVVWKQWNRIGEARLRAVVGASLGGWLGALVAFLFLPLMQAMALMSWLWFLLGTGMEAHRIERSWATPAGGSPERG